MKQATIPSVVSDPSPIVTIINNHAATTSLDVARVFEKNHQHVTEAIRKLVKEIPNDFELSNFRHIEIIEENANGMKIDKSYYEMTRDGFTLLAMGFTGKKALQFKLAYIEKFNAMERMLVEQAAPSKLKTCSKCRKQLPLDMFQADNRTKDGRHYYCYECRNLIQNSSARRQSSVNESALVDRVSEQILARIGGAAPQKEKRMDAIEDFSTVLNQVLSDINNADVARKLWKIFHGLSLVFIGKVAEIEKTHNITDDAGVTIDELFARLERLENRKPGRA